MQIKLILRVQTCESPKKGLLNTAVFCDVITLLYQKYLLSKEAIFFGSVVVCAFRRLHSTASRNIIRRQMISFVKWLETSEEASVKEK